MHECFELILGASGGRPEWVSAAIQLIGHEMPICRVDGSVEPAPRGSGGDGAAVAARRAMAVARAKAVTVAVAVAVARAMAVTVAVARAMAVTGPEAVAMAVAMVEAVARAVILKYNGDDGLELVSSVNALLAHDDPPRRRWPHPIH